MVKSGRYGIIFLKNLCRGCRRHLVVWMAILIFIYSIFYISQYVVVNNEHDDRLRTYEKIEKSARRVDVSRSPSFLTNTPPSWGNVTGLKEQIKPVLTAYSKTLRQKGSRSEFKLPWDIPEVNYQSKACRDPLTLNITSKATLIVSLHGARIDKALTSLFFILKLTSIKLVEDVILIGDIGLPSIYRDIYDLFPEYLPTFRLFISPKRTTVTQARKYAAKFAHGDVLVFLDGLVMVTEHWLETLMAAILKHPTSVIQPVVFNNNTILDDFKRPVSFQKKELQLDLTLKEVNVPIFPDHFINDYQKASIISSSAFALTKALYSDLRELEEYSGFSDLEMTVLSLKAWMCGGGVLLAPCSCVVLQPSPASANQSSSSVSPTVSKTMMTKRRHHLLFISSAWFSPYDDVYKCLLPKSRHLRLTYTEKRSIKLYKLFYNRLNCKKFTEFVRLAQPNLTKPKPNSTNYGTLSLQGHDLFLTRSDGDSNLKFVTDLALQTYPFSFSNFALSVKNMCVTYVPNSSIKLMLCQPTNSNQKWVYNQGQLQLRKNPHLCIVKQTNRDIPTVNLCKNTNVLSTFNFTLSFDSNCIK